MLTLNITMAFNTAMVCGVSAGSGTQSGRFGCDAWNSHWEFTEGHSHGLDETSSLSKKPNVLLEASFVKQHISLGRQGQRLSSITALVDTVYMAGSVYTVDTGFSPIQWKSRSRFSYQELCSRRPSQPPPPPSPPITCKQTALRNGALYPSHRYRQVLLAAPYRLDNQECGKVVYTSAAAAARFAKHVLYYRLIVSKHMDLYCNRMLNSKTRWRQQKY